MPSRNARFVITAIFSAALLLAAALVLRRAESKSTSTSKQPSPTTQQPNQAPVLSTVTKPTLEDRAQGAQEKLPAKPAPPRGASLSRRFDGATERKSPDFTAMAQSIRLEPDNSLPEEYKKLRVEEITTLPLGSCYTPLDGSPVPPAWAYCNAGKMATGLASKP
jgi:hypothetical protein